MTYPDLPTTSITHKRDKITLPKAVIKENNRGSITLVQKARRVSERAKKRVAKGKHVRIELVRMELVRMELVRMELEKEENQVIKWRGGHQNGLR